MKLLAKKCCSAIYRSKLGCRKINHCARSSAAQRERFTVDGSQIESWASLKSFKPKDEPDKDGANFRHEKRPNETHRSTSEPEAILARKGPGKEAKLCFSLNVLRDNRHGLIVNSCVETADGFAERRAALKLLDRIRTNSSVAVKTLGADKG